LSPGQPSSAKVLAKNLALLAEAYKEPLTEEALTVWTIALGDLGPDQLARGFKWAVQESKFWPRPAEVREHGLNGETPELAPVVIKPVADPDCRRCGGWGYRERQDGAPHFTVSAVECPCLHMPKTTDRLLTLTQVRRMAETDPEGARAYVQSHWDRYYAVGRGYPYLLRSEGYLVRPALAGKAQDALCEGGTK
jgi:hypothetical protein